MTRINIVSDSDLNKLLEGFKSKNGFQAERLLSRALEKKYRPVNGFLVDEILKDKCLLRDTVFNVDGCYTGYDMINTDPYQTENFDNGMINASHFYCDIKEKDLVDLLEMDIRIGSPFSWSSPSREEYPPLRDDIVSLIDKMAGFGISKLDSSLHFMGVVPFRQASKYLGVIDKEGLCDKEFLAETKKILSKKFGIKMKGPITADDLIDVINVKEIHYR